MAARKCPQCWTVVPATHVVAYTDGIECPGCKTPLEVSAVSRYLATGAGLAAGVLVWRWVGQPGSTLGWVLPVVSAFFAFSIVAPLLLMLTADLRLRPAAAVGELAPAAASQGSGHAGSHR